MTSTQALRYADQIIERNREALRPVILLLYGFKNSRGDPLGEAMMRAVLKRFYTETDHCEDFGLAHFVREGLEEDELLPTENATSLPV